MRGAHPGETRRIAHRRQRHDGILDFFQRGRAVLGQPLPREFVDRRQRLEQQRARDQHTAMAEHQIEVHTVCRTGDVAMNASTEFASD